MYLEEKIRASIPPVNFSGWLGAAREEIALQRDRLIVWAPVCLGAGIGLYFMLPFEPPLVLVSALAFLATVIWVFIWPLREGRWFPLWLGATGLLLAVAGFSGAQWRTALLDTIMLEKETGPAQVTGTITGIDRLEEGKGLRFVLEDLTIEDIAPGDTPVRVRITVRNGAENDYKAGDTITVLANLNPPSAPVAPGAFDFQRYAYYEEFGGLGFAYTAPEIVRRDEGSAFTDRLEAWRQHIVVRIMARLSDPEAAVAAALVTGERAAIADEINEELRISGLFHMLSISGLHVAMVSAIIFFTLRFVMALFPRFALYHPIKKYAAALTIGGIVFYTIFVGGTVPTIRSSFMVGLVLLAVIVDRSAISLRTVALAALIILLLWPESLWSASFQMSFAAVTALIIAYDMLSPYWSGWRRDAGFIRRIALYILSISLTTIVATLATAPFSLYHFQNLAVYSLLANMVAVPIMGVVVMPAALLIYVLAPFGLDGPAIWLMGKGVQLVLAVAHEVAALPESVILMPAWPFSVFMLTVLGGLVLLFWKGYGKMAALVPFVLAVTLLINYRPPDILISAEAGLLAIRDEEGRLHLSTLQKERFAAENWLRRNGQTEDDRSRWPAEGKAFDGLTCGENGCRYVREGRRVAFSLHPESQVEDCRWADIVIAVDPVRTACDAPLVIDRFDVWRNGAHAVRLDGRYETVRGARGQRPWTVSVK